MSFKENIFIFNQNIRHTGIPGPWTQDLDAGLWTLDSVKTLKFKSIQSFGNNESILITSFLNSTLIKIFAHFKYENLSGVYSFQATLSNHLKIPKTRGFQMMWSGKVDLKWINIIFCSCWSTNNEIHFGSQFFSFFLNTLLSKRNDLFE